ncbi:MAG: glutamate--tRNA ligase [Mariprofundaceae bacterium]|nr:glutamate--tRNA ligase [Mariprofundaceae bacterium]
MTDKGMSEEGMSEEATTEVVTRFAPSPTGLMHLGNVRTALLNWLYARKLGGRFLLRFEDTDASRSEAEFVEALKQDLLWLGLDWDGDALFQSKHAGQHREALDALAEKGLAYRCFCTETQLNLDRKLATSRGLPPRYSGKCRRLSNEESLQRSESESFVWRLAIHNVNGEVRVSDALRGNVVFARRDLDDPVVVRSDGTFTFLLPNAIDDAVDGITHALRGDDHLTNSAYQVWLLEALGLSVPTYVHHGLLLGEDGAKLSKRTGSHSVAELREDGLIPQALVQAMTRLGHPNIADDALSTADLLQAFDAEHILRSSVKWSNDEMWRWHTRLLHHLDADALLPLIKTSVPAANLDFAKLIAGNLERADDALQYTRLVDAEVALNEEAQAVVDAAAEGFYTTALQLWQGSTDTGWKPWMNAVKEATGCKGKNLFMPLRVALTGVVHGPEMSAVVDFLGKEGVSARLQDLLDS